MKTLYFISNWKDGHALTSPYERKADLLADYTVRRGEEVAQITEDEISKEEFSLLWRARVKNRLSAYERGKERARAEAKEYQESYYNPALELSMGEIAEIHSRFEKLGRRYGLMREFKENGIL